MPQPLRQPQQYSARSAFMVQTPEPERELALAVLHRALRDLVEGDATTRAAVQGWLHECPYFAFWCAAVDLDPLYVREQALQRTREA